MRGVNGIALIVIGLLHSLALVIPGAIGFQGIWSEIRRTGVIDAVSGSSGANLRVWGYYWFLIPGFMLIILGMLCAWVERSVQRSVPAFVGWALLAFCAFAILPDTGTGFWLVVAVAFSMMFAAKREAPRGSAV